MIHIKYRVLKKKQERAAARDKTRGWRFSSGEDYYRSAKKPDWQ